MRYTKFGRFWTYIFEDNGDIEAALWTFIGVSL